MHRVLFNGCFALASSIGIILLLPSLAQAQSIAQVKEIQGRVQRSIPPAYPQLQPGDSLESGDLIYVDASAKAIVRCHDGQQHQLPSGTSSINNFCPPPLSGGRMPTRQSSDSLALRTIENLNPTQRASLDAAIAQLSTMPPEQRSLALASLYARFDLPKRAIEILESSKRPLSIQAASLLGRLYWQLREDAKAEQAYRYALQLAGQTNAPPRSQQIFGIQSALLQVADSYLQRQQRESTEALLKDLTQLPAPLEYQRQIYLADLYQQRGELEQAATALDRAAVVYPHRPLTYCYRAVIAAKRGHIAQSRADNLRCSAPSTNLKKE